MLRILENYVKGQEYQYLMMDGTTAVQSRQMIIKRFNEVKYIIIV